MTKDEALKLALDALETSMYPQQKQLQAITAIKESLANEALEKMAENARELGLDYEPAQEPVAWEGGEGWESLAWELCADENGEDSCNELIWEGGPIPEPWGDRWMKYEEEAKRLIALVQKHTTPPQRTWVGLMRGVRVEGDTVVISVKGGNDSARELCGALIEEMNR
jgi:hypothetical protein